MYSTTSPTAPGVFGQFKIALQDATTYEDTVAALRRAGFTVVSSTDTHAVFGRPHEKLSTAVFQDRLFDNHLARIEHYRRVYERLQQYREESELAMSVPRSRWAWPPDGPHPGPEARGMAAKAAPVRRTVPWAVSMRSYAGR